MASLFHGVGWTMPPSANPVTLEIKQIREIGHALDVLTTRIKTIIAAEATITQSELDDLFLNQSTKDAAFAVAKGFAHRIGEPLIVNADKLTHSPPAP